MENGIHDPSTVSSAKKQDYREFRFPNPGEAADGAA